MKMASNNKKKKNEKKKISIRRGVALLNRHSEMAPRINRRHRHQAWRDMRGVNN